ncbi:hypothetical protein PROFUN_06210 [Planoprotostelium fungivorum]|uniref:ADF-H domain-containing protein n=1 Tax=Planoprotostelium fungivorum TaxID=1890364 RepID=A0A2P6MYZ7_9EUKA|nr:hypothetical protein PROFUN_06210 [Planoprotostelium fungivorum]
MHRERYKEEQMLLFQRKDISPFGQKTARENLQGWEALTRCLSLKILSTEGRRPNRSVDIVYGSTESGTAFRGQAESTQQLSVLSVNSLEVMASGVGVSDEVVTKFQDLKLGKSLRYIIYKLNETSTEVVVEKTAPASATYAEFQSSLPPNDCRYAVFDFEFSTPDGGSRNKIVFILWAPDGSKIKPKMLYTSSKADLRKKLVGIATEVQATDASEIDHASVLEKVSKDAR